ncbi:MAG TPA: biotin--[acetyl-CoA-carboxylase] ligase [Candidatus Limnocylindrales bacterium]|nr:biotin--[acetyl-CoA-carboxylase] ligase [Candidatus Limnocylindrales bacterium]
MAVEAPFITRQERFALVGSTNDVVRDWLAAGEREVCLAVADEQSAGRGRENRTWSAPAGRALLLSLGFRPTWLAPDRVWRLAGTVAMAMADAAEEVAGLKDGSIRLKWPNDLVVEDEGRQGSPGAVRKLAGVLGETDGLGTADPRAVVGIGINADWPAAEFPPELAGSMTSLREASGGRPIDLALLLDAFTARLEVRIAALRGGRFDVADYVARQLTNGRLVRLEGHDGRSEVVRALRVDAVGGSLVVEDPAMPGGERQVVSGEIRHLRLDEAV